MKLSARGILAGLAGAFLLLELILPPAFITEMTRAWGGGWHTRRSREVIGLFQEGSDGWDVDYLVLSLECILVGLAVFVGWSALGKRPGADLDVAESRALARSAVVLHTSVVVLPLCNAGADTVWLVNPAMFIIIGAVFLWPNFIALAAAIRLSSSSDEDCIRWASKSWLPVFLFVVAILWSLFLIVVSLPLFDVKGPLGGVILGTVALWLTAYAQMRAAHVQ